MTATHEVRRATPASSTRAWQKKWRIEHERGHRRVVAPDRAEAHVQELTEHYGVSIRAIAEAAGVSAGMVSNLNRGLKISLNVQSERAILAVKAADIMGRPNPEGFVPNIGSRRRMQALLAIGWRHQDLTPMLGFTSSNVVHQAGEWVTRSKHDKVKEVYDQLWNKRGPATKVSITRITKAGYAPPLAWDEETIDDPTATPNLGATAAGHGPTPEGAIKASDALVENVEFLVDDGNDWEALTKRLGRPAETLDKALRRQGRADLIHRAKNMAERRALSRT